MKTTYQRVNQPASDNSRTPDTQAGVRILESVELDFSRYGDTLFEVLFAGGRLAGGGNVVEEGKKLDTNVRLRPTLCPPSCLRTVYGQLQESIAINPFSGCVILPVWVSPSV